VYEGIWSYDCTTNVACPSSLLPFRPVATECRMENSRCNVRGLCRVSYWPFVLLTLCLVSRSYRPSINFLVGFSVSE
jgi:hypothetical protein